jgi:hypothetical protein
MDFGLDPSPSSEAAASAAPSAFSVTALSTAAADSSFAPAREEPKVKVTRTAAAQMAMVRTGHSFDFIRELIA